MENHVEDATNDEALFNGTSEDGRKDVRSPRDEGLLEMVSEFAVSFTEVTSV